MRTLYWYYLKYIRCNFSLCVIHITIFFPLLNVSFDICVWVCESNWIFWTHSEYKLSKKKLSKLAMEMNYNLCIYCFKMNKNLEQCCIVWRKNNKKAHLSFFWFLLFWMMIVWIVKFDCDFLSSFSSTYFCVCFVLNFLFLNQFFALQNVDDFIWLANCVFTVVLNFIECHLVVWYNQLL